jgi:hypothetical protein
MPVSLIAPDTDNYQVGKGIVSFKKEGTDEFVDLGNVAELEYTPSIEKLDHFSSRTGVKTKDRSIVQTRSGELRILMEELTANNMAMLLLGIIDPDAVGGPTVDIFATDSVKGEVKFQATNDVGPRWDLNFYNVEFSPSGSFNPISDEWNQIEITGEVLVANGGPNDGKVGIAQITNLPPDSPSP